ncbi:MAG: type II secretion system minor pseudopilin GspI, partial [Pseudomonadota bacterium]
MNRTSPAAGFTLIEVLVALIIVAFGMGALLATLSSAADTAGVLRDKTFAQWIAMNRIAELRLRSIRPEVGKTSGDVEFAGQKWRWSQEVLDPGIAGMLRIDVSVMHAGAVT